MTRWDASLIGLLLFGFLLRLSFLSADPVYYQWIGYITDEGRWSEHARALAQSGALTNQGPLHLALAPLYQLFSWIVFEALGVSYATARLPAAISGCVLLIVLWRFLVPRVAPPASFAALAFVVFHADYVMLSRIGIPEMSAMAASLVAFSYVLSDRPHRRRLLTAGVWIGVAVALKATVLPILGIFAAVAYADAPAGSRLSERLRRGAWVVAPAALGAVVALLGASPFLIARLEWFEELHVIGNYLGMRPPLVMTEVLLRGVITAPLCIAAVGFWITGIGWLVVRPAADDPRWRLARGAAIWAGLYLPLTLGLEYFPDRYIVHIFTPLVVLLAVGVDWLWTEGWHGLADVLQRDRRDRGWPAVAWITLPSAFPLAPLLVAVPVLFGFENRIRFLLLAVLVAWAALAGLFSHWREREFVRRFAIAFPVVITLIWSASWALWDDPFGFWPAAVGDGLFSRSAGRIAIATIVVTLFARRPPSLQVATIGATAALASIWLLHLAPAYLDRHYTLSAISADLGKRLGDTHLIEMNAEGLFLENRVRYRWVPPEWPESRSQFFVTAMRYWGDPVLFRTLYEPVSHYDVYISPRFAALQPSYWINHCLTLDGHMASLYRLRDPSLATE